MNTQKLVAVLMLGFALFCTTVSAQDQENNSQDNRERANSATDSEQAQAAIAKTIKKIQKLLKEKDYAAVAKRMTKKAQDEIAVAVVVKGIVIPKLESQVGAEALGVESTEHLKKLLSKHKLDKLDIELRSGIQMLFRFPGASAEEADEVSEKILKAIGTGGNRWAIVSAIAKSSELPLGSQAYAGKVIEVDFAKDKQSAQIIIENPTDVDGAQGIQGPAAKTVIDFVLKDGGWLHNGIDKESTMDLIELEMAPMEMMPNGSGGPIDF